MAALVLLSLVVGVTATSSKLVKNNEILNENLCEFTPLVYKGRLLLLECIRPASGGQLKDYYLVIRDVASGKELARFAEGYGLACAILHKGTFYVYASRWEEDSWNDITLFKSKDLKTWTSKSVIEQDNEHIYNTSVCKGPEGFVIAYETDDARFPPFSIKFAVSKDLENWMKVQDVVYGKDRYTACPCLRFVNRYYYMMYLEQVRGQWRFETYLTRSPDLKTWQPSPMNPILSPGPGEDINTSDPDVVEFGGKVYLYYAIGDQRTYSRLKHASFDGTLREFFEHFYPRLTPKLTR